MPNTPVHVLILAERPDAAELLVEELCRAGFEPNWQRVDTEAAYLACLDPVPDLILADSALSQWDTLHALHALQERTLDIPFILIVGMACEEEAVAYLKQGATDYLFEGHLARLGPAAGRALDAKRLREAKRQAEAELKRQKKFYETILQSLTEGIVVLDQNETIIFANPAAAAMLGRTLEEAIGLDQAQARQLIPADQHPVFDSAADQHKRGEVARYEIDVWGEHATRKSLLVGSSPHLEKGHFAGTVAVLTDITARKQMEVSEHDQRMLAEMLRDTAEALARLIDPDAVMARILDNMGRVVPYDFSSIVLIRGDSAQVAYCRGWSSDEEAVIRAARFPLSLTNLHEMIHTRSPLFISDTATYPDWLGISSRTRSYVSAPIQIHGNVIGFLSLDSVQPGFFTARHAERLAAFADQAAIAIENAQLYDELRQKAGELEQRVAERSSEVNQINTSLQQEIYEHKQTEQALRESEARLRSFFELPLIGMALTSVEKGILLINDKLCEMFGYSRDELLQLTWPELTYPDDLAADVAQFDRVMAGETEGYSLDKRFLRKDGQPISVIMTCRCLRDPQDNVTHFVSLAQDITERKQAEQALRESEERFRVIFEQSTVGISLTTPDGRLFKVNQAFADMVGHTLEEIQQLGFAQITYPEDVAKSWECIRCLLAHEQDSYRMEKRYVHKNGTVIWADVSASLLWDRTGTPLHLITSILDVSERKRAEQELRELSRLKTEFLSTAAHELRTPLTSIRGFSEILLTRTVTEERRRRYVSLINDQATELGALIDDLLDLSRLEARRILSLNLQPMNLAELLEEGVMPFRKSAPRHDIQVVSLPALLVFRADKFRLGQVLRNLLSNAVKYSPDGGAITIRCRTTADYLEVSVQDTGVGMTAEQQVHLFEKFYRVDNSNTGIRGSGLGLAISKLIVELHGGTIGVESTPGVGSTFYFTLPLTEKTNP